MLQQKIYFYFYRFAFLMILSIVISGLVSLFLIFFVNLFLVLCALAVEAGLL